MRYPVAALSLARPLALLAGCSNEPDGETADGASDPASEQALNGDVR